MQMQDILLDRRKVYQKLEVRFTCIRAWGWPALYPELRHKCAEDGVHANAEVGGALLLTGTFQYMLGAFTQ